MYWLGKFVSNHFLTSGIKISSSLYVSLSKGNKVLLYKWVFCKPNKYRVVYCVCGNTLSKPHIQKIDYNIHASYIITYNYMGQIVLKIPMVYKNYVTL